MYESLTLDAQASASIETEPTTTKSMTAKITSYLRWIGSLLIILSAISFMLQGYSEISATYRYWVSLGLTLLLCGGGLVCAYLFNETKGARIFFGLGTAFLSVQVSQVGAMIYAYLHGENALQPVFTSLQFNHVSPGIVALDLLITSALLILVSYASFSILARKHLKTLLLASCTANMVLILPIRDAQIIPFIIAGLFLFIRQIEHGLHSDSSMQLFEGLAARALLSLPLWIIIGRSLLHPSSSLLATVILAIIVVYCIYDIKRYTNSGVIIYLAQWVGTFSAIAIWGNFSVEYGDITNPLFILPAGFILFSLSGQVSYHSRLYRIVSTLTIVGLNFSAILSQQGITFIAPVVSIASGIFLTIFGMKQREKIAFFCGNICVIAGILFYWEYAVNLYSNTPWISSIILGLCVILLASYIENKEQQIKLKTRYYFNALKTWN
ncbi:MAG: hypothetical protein QM500_03120 [Methylococcales bacterium]